MLIQFRQGLVQTQTPTFVKITFPYADLLSAEANTVIAFADGDKDYIHTEQESVAQAWGPLTLNRDQWLYWDINTRTGIRTFGVTLVEPVVSAQAPTTPVADQHWFNSATSTMNVWTGAGWSRRIRVFACKLVSGKIPVSVSISSPTFTGTQVGVQGTPVYAGHILFDGVVGGAIRDSRGLFVTTEDELSTNAMSLSSVKLASVAVTGEAQQSMAPYTVVVFSEFGKIVHADQYTADQTRQFGIIESAAVIGQTVPVSNHGLITSRSWDWTAAGVNAKLYCDASGTLVTSPVIPNQTPVATVLDTHTIVLGSPITTSVGSTSSSSSLATQLAYGIVRLSVPAADDADPIAVGDGDGRLTNARPALPHTHTINQITDASTIVAGYLPLAGGTMSGDIQLRGNPTANLHPATKEYVDATVVSPTGPIGSIQFNNTTFGGSENFTVAVGAAAVLSLGSQTTPNAEVVSVGNIRVAGNSVRLSTSNVDQLAIGTNGAWTISNSTGTAGQVLTSSGGSSAPTWADPVGSATGGISTIQLSLPSQFRPVSPSTSGDITVTWADQPAGLVFASAQNGTAPVFRTLQSSDLPTVSVGVGTYGSTSAIPVITTDTYGRISSISTAAITIPTAVSALTNDSGYQTSSNVSSAVSLANTIQITQPSHGFVAGNVLYHDGAVFALADASTAITSEVVGIVTQVIGDTFRLATHGVVSGISVTAGMVYFLSTTPGALTTTEPTTAGHVSKPLLIAINSTSGVFVNQRGITI